MSSEAITLGRKLFGRTAGNRLTRRELRAAKRYRKYHGMDRSAEDLAAESLARRSGQKPPRMRYVGPR